VADDQPWLRTTRAAVVEMADKLLLVDRSGVVRELSGESAALASAILKVVSRPHTAAELVAHIESLTGGPLAPAQREVVAELMALLAETGAIARPPEPTLRPTRNVVLAASGAIAATHVTALAAALVHRGHRVEVALTETATRFVSVDAVAAITHREPHVSMWPRVAHAPVPHIALAAWAELVIVYPATATTIARIARGDCSELVAAIVTSSRAPVVIAPSMNEAMLAAPAVQRNLETLRSDGRLVVNTTATFEVAVAPSVRTPMGAGAPAPEQLLATIEALDAAGVLVRPPHARHDAVAWDAAYLAALVPWASDACDTDLAAALVELAPTPRRVLDVGCGLGQVARYAASRGHRVVAIDISDVALALARDRAAGEAGAARDIVWLRDDVCASALVGDYDVIVDRATLHALPRARASAWARTIDRLAAPGAVAIVVCHAEAVADATSGYSGDELADLLPRFEVVFDRDAKLPSPRDATLVPARLVALRRVR
jgi:SAM-dependent methyltransferase